MFIKYNNNRSLPHTITKGAVMRYLLIALTALLCFCSSPTAPTGGGENVTYCTVIIGFYVGGTGISSMTVYADSVYIATIPTMTRDTLTVPDSCALECVYFRNSQKWSTTYTAYNGLEIIYM